MTTRLVLRDVTGRRCGFMPGLRDVGGAAITAAALLLLFAALYRYWMEAAR